MYSRPEDLHMQRKSLYNTRIFHLFAAFELVSVKTSWCKEEDVCTLGEHLLVSMDEQVTDIRKKKRWVIKVGLSKICDF